MRGLRWLLLLIILGILGGVMASYRYQRREARKNAPATPVALPADTNASGIDFSWGESAGGKPQVQIKAKALRQTSDAQKAELQSVELRIFQKDGKHYDLVKSPHADFNQNEGKMSSETEVEITLEVPVEGQPLHQLTSVKTSGLTYESKTGKAATAKPATFTFENGDGTCVGATYDPNSKELHLLNNVVLNLRGAGPKSKPMKIETAELTYKEGESTIWLMPWSKLTRAETTIDAGPGLMKLKERRVESIDAQKAHGVDKYPKRQLDYAADLMHVAYNDVGEVQKVTGVGNARLNTDAGAGQTNMTANTVDLEFVQENDESTLTKAIANGTAMLESKPAPAPDGKTPSTRVLRSETIEVQMRPGGKEIESVRTHAPGVLEFLPNQPQQHRRVLHGERMTMTYAPRNVIRNFQAVKVATETFPLPAAKGKERAIARTSSGNMTADFDDKGQMQHMKQWENFTYEEGDRKARAQTATMDSGENVMDLESGARFWDETGSTSGDHIHLLQNTGDFTVEGHVNTSRLPDKKDPKKDDKKNNSTEMLDSDEPTQGMAQRMSSANRSHLVHYEGNAILWQASNRIQADKIDIDRDKKTLAATGHVVSQFLDKPKPEESEKIKSPPPASIFTVVRAANLVYTEENRLAHYTGGVTFDRPGLSVKSQDLQAYLNPKDSDADSRINKAYADIQVEIVQNTLQRKRTGTGDHAEYYTDDDKIILRGAPEAVLVDSKRGDTRGQELTYFMDDDRLLVNGAPGKPVKSRLHKK